MKPTIKSIISSLIAVIVCMILTSCAHAEITIANNGKSTFTIIIPTNAPTSVKNAAQELQKDITLATNAKLPLQNDAANIKGSFISVGNTQIAQSAGISSDKMADESFRIVTKNGNLYILGPDTPDGGWTKNNGTSNGTANGVYTFLEDFLDVRWLMPGDLGRDVPSKSTFTIDDIDRTIVPRFAGMRQLTHLADYANYSQKNAINDWTNRQKTGRRAGSTNWYYMHNWIKTINRNAGLPATTETTSAVKKWREEHPDWVAMDEHGRRTPYLSNTLKFETTNQNLVRWFADQALETFKNSEHPVAFSLSPSDGRRYSQSPESKAWYEPSPNTGFDPEGDGSGVSISSLYAKWYHDVAQIVAKEAPGRMVTGFFYSDYIYPPKKFNKPLPDNFSPVIAPSRVYGYGLYREDVQKYFHEVMNGWADIVTAPWFYYDLPSSLLRQPYRIFGATNFPGGTGLVTSPAADNLNIIFSQLVKSHISGANLYGDNAWSNTALANYLMAKLEWDPTLDANKIQQEWLHRAYGDAAGEVMEQFYIKLDNWFREYFQNNEKDRSELTPQMFKEIYGKHYPEMEKIFLQAKAQSMTDVQKQRLQLIEDNLIVTQWRLRNIHYLAKDFSSPLQRNDAQISDLIAKENADFPLFPGVTNPRSTDLKPLKWKVLLSQKTPPAKSTFPKLGDNHIFIYVAQDGDIHISTQSVQHDMYFAAYEIKDLKGKILASGIFTPQKPIVFPAKAGESYILSIPQRKSVQFQLQVENAAVAEGDFQNNTLTLISEKKAPVYLLYVPGKAPMGIYDEKNNVIIKTPYSAALAGAYIKRKFTKARTTSFDTWRFAPDPQNDLANRGVLKSTFDDSSWAKISAHDWWQFQGFPDYHGSAWYRMTFRGEPLQKGEVARIYFGAVDGNVQVYLNGKKIGEHLLEAPDFAGWDKAFALDATKEIQPGENILAIQVISKPAGSSGITGGAVLVQGK